MSARPEPREQLLRFGPGGGLIGVLSLPAGEAAGRAPLLIPNTGLEHRVGPNRLHVELARGLAADGVPVLRLDLAGMGDSARPAAGSDAVADLRAALDALQSRGLGGRYRVLGLCSGAHDAHGLAVADPRIVGAAFLDGYAYATARFRRRYWLSRLGDPRRILAALGRRLRPPADSAADPSALDYFVTPPLARFHSELAGLQSRGLHLLYLYTGEVQNEYNYREQLLDAVPALRDDPRLDLHHWPQADHTFSRPGMRADLLALLRGWLQRCDGAQPSGRS
ncbi:MAG TPA: alpha/beta fold hydrolase [Nevskiaceae bacterium]|nr:alpha/beta fold hydrolase [Nevskiaceae bacterium]